MPALALPIADTWGMHGDIGAGWWIVMVVMMVLFWGGILWGLGWLIRGDARNAGPRTERRRPHETALDILDRGLADGSISPEDYQRRRDILLRAAPVDGHDRPDGRPPPRVPTSTRSLK